MYKHTNIMYTPSLRNLQHSDSHASSCYTAARVPQWHHHIHIYGTTHSNMCHVNIYLGIHIYIHVYIHISTHTFHLHTCHSRSAAQRLPRILLLQRRGRGRERHPPPFRQGMHLLARAKIVWPDIFLFDHTKCVSVRSRVLQCAAVGSSVSPAIVETGTFLFDGNVMSFCHGSAVWCSVAQCGAVWRSVVQCGAVWCGMGQCVAVCCSVLQCGAVCCSALQCDVMSFCHGSRCVYIRLS